MISNGAIPEQKTSASYGNIFEGEYSFQLKAQSPEGAWSIHWSILSGCFLPGGEHGGHMLHTHYFFYGD